MDSSPLLSIVIPTYNEEKAILKTLSCLRDLQIPHEIIVSDASSKDRTVALAKQGGADLVTVCPPQTGRSQPTISANRNHGGHQARGPFLVFLDCDCRIDTPTKFFQCLLDHFEKNKKLVAVTVKIVTEPAVRTIWDAIIEGANNLFYILSNNIFHSGAALGKFQMMRTEAFKAVNGFREDLPMSEDVDMFARLSKIGRTYDEWHLKVYHSNRRAHTIGWPKLLWIWTYGTFYFWFTDKPYLDEWKDIR